jgi:N-acetylglucosamine malate deacetylase 1
MLELRRARPEDGDRLLAWVNDPEVIATKLRTRAPIAPAVHAQWFAARLADPETDLWILELSGRSVGQIRLQGPDDAVVIDVYVVPEARRRGLAKAAILRAFVALRSRRPAARRVVAEIRHENVSSRVLFEAMGFVAAGGDSECTIVVATLPTGGTIMDPANVAAVFAHPDDEVLGAGATLAGLAAAGARVRILLLASGLAARAPADEAELENLRADAREAARRVESFLGGFPADTVFTHHGGDLNIDHRRTFEAVVTACRPLPGSVVRTILAAEVLSSSEWAPPPLGGFVPTEFVDISDSIGRKIEAMSAYAGEMRDWPHPRSPEGIRTLAALRGQQAGFAAAEAFQTIRRRSFAILPVRAVQQ